MNGSSMLPPATVPRRGAAPPPPSSPPGATYDTKYPTPSAAPAATPSGSAAGAKPVRPYLPPPERKGLLGQFLSDPVSLLVYGALGAAAGMFYSGMQNVAGERHVSYVLDPRPENFIVDEGMSDMMHDLAVFQRHSSAGVTLYARLMHQIDRILGLILSIRKSKEGGRYGDRGQVHLFVQHCFATLMEFRESIYKSPEAYLAMDRLKSRIEERLREYILTVYCRTQHLYPTVPAPRAMPAPAPLSQPPNPP